MAEQCDKDGGACRLEQHHEAQRSQDYRDQIGHAQLAAAVCRMVGGEREVQSA
jgi:hypothetical protein